MGVQSEALVPPPWPLSRVCLANWWTRLATRPQASSQPFNYLRLKFAQLSDSGLDLLNRLLT